MKFVKIDTFDGKVNTTCVWDETENRIGAVVIVHGMAEHAERYDAFAKFLNSEGYVVLADNHRGHKFNPDGAKGIVCGDSFSNSVEDIKAVVDYAKSVYGLEVVLLGHSYGSFLSQRYIERYASTVRGVILSGTAYMKGALVGMAKVIAGVQKAFCGGEKTAYLIDKLSFGNYNKPFESQGQKFAWLSRDRSEVAKYEADEFCGYPLSIDYYYSFFKGVMAMYGDDSYAAAKGLPVMIAVGINSIFRKDSTYLTRSIRERVTRYSTRSTKKKFMRICSPSSKRGSPVKEQIYGKERHCNIGCFTRYRVDRGTRILRGR